MKRLTGGILTALIVTLVIGGLTGGAQSPTPYKLGMFEQDGRRFVGLVLFNDTQVVDLSVGYGRNLSIQAAQDARGALPASTRRAARRST